MNNKKLALIIGAILLLFVIWKILPAAKPRTESSQFQVAATIAPLGDMVRNVAGPDAVVVTILPTGASPHAYEPTPQDAIGLMDSKILFSIGHGFDDWANELVSNAPNIKIVTPDQGVKLRDMPFDERDADEPDQTQDPHYWLSIPNAETMVNNIAVALAQADPTHADDYARNAKGYVAKLHETDAYIKNKLSSLANRNLITHHNAWGYFAQEYGLKVVGTFEISPGKEPTIKQLNDIQNKIKEYGIATVFIEPQLSDQSVRPLVQDLKLQVRTLDPEGSTQNMGYLDLMRYNADTLAQP